MTGNRSAQNMVGFFYATGYQGAVERDQAKVLNTCTIESDL